MTRSPRQLLAATALLLVSTASLANDGNADLYDAVAPADSAFVRVLNLSDRSIDVTLSGKVNPQKVAPASSAATASPLPAATRSRSTNRPSSRSSRPTPPAPWCMTARA